MVGTQTNTYFIRPSHSDQYALKEFSVMGFEATPRRTSLSLLHSRPVLAALYCNVQYLGTGSLLLFLMRFLKETNPLQQHNLGQVSGSLERNLTA